MRSVALVFLIVAIMLPFAFSQALDPVLEAQLKRVVPNATSFSAKQASPSHFIAYTGESGSRTVAGYVFWTTELEPLERGYDGPIKMLVGINRSALITGILVTQHREPYGDFSVDRPEFALQFRGKDIRDPFKVGEDVDAVSRATITITSSARAIRNGARRLVRGLLAARGSGG